MAIFISEHFERVGPSENLAVISGRGSPRAFLLGDVMEVSYGYCHCGCGRKTTIHRYNDPERGYRKGESHKFIQGHNPKRLREKSLMRHVTPHGYVRVFMPEHPRATAGGYVFEHTLIAEKALGKLLLKPHCVHHHGPKKDQCLVICEDHAYHCFLHQRMRALRACGNANWIRCGPCKKYDDPINMYIAPGLRIYGWHLECQRAYKWKRRDTINKKTREHYKENRDRLLKRNQEYKAKRKKLGKNY